ncbi:type III secretion protein [Pseudomonas sp. lyk4-R2A-8]|uniref:type III secretion protein n=1 Tax=Pseudomonas sp. lyk4-R2A-8 TaxID=3040316 RepID=UPI002552F87E|nr:type III secretion protein [Pseudomonas sp. lyk4-R2A-8]
MNSNLAWAQWWSAPWLQAHEDWRELDNYPAHLALHRTRQVVVGTYYGVAPCLPPPPDPVLLQLAIASAAQLELALALIGSVCRPACAQALDEELYQWCNRLSKALALDMAQPDVDPLQLLRAWVPADTWQRIRLRFPRQRVLDLEAEILSRGDSQSRLDTLWHAVVWRIGGMSSNDSASSSEAHGD